MTDFRYPDDGADIRNTLAALKPGTRFTVTFVAGDRNPADHSDLADPENPFLFEVPIARLHPSNNPGSNRLGSRTINCIHAIEIHTDDG